MNALLEMLSAASAEQQERRREQRPSSPPDVLCVTLREVAARYDAPCPFKAGDLVTPRRGYIVKNPGEPGVVIETAAQPIRNFVCAEDQTDVASPAFGAKLDVRVAYERDGHIVAYWQESWVLDHYTGPGAEPEKAEAA